MRLQTEWRIVKRDEQKLVRGSTIPKEEAEVQGEGTGGGDVRENLWRAGCPERMLCAFLWRSRQT